MFQKTSILLPVLRTASHRLTCAVWLSWVGFGVLGIDPRPTAWGVETAQTQQEEFFESAVRPLLVEHCVECHGSESQEGNLRLDHSSGLRRGGDSGPVVVPGRAASSLLVRAVGYEESQLQMPPDQKLSIQAIGVLHQWVQDGAFWPDEPEPDDEAGKPEPPAARIGEFQQSHWAYQPVRAVAPPETLSSRGESPPLQPIDRFIRQRLEASGLQPNPPADRRTLVHRAYFTLLGLPPTYEQVQDFLADDSPDALARLVDDLLGNQHYGERWARHWLDLARFAETMGYLAGNRETRYPYAFTYRDYVIDAFNDDKPYDRFIVEQIAADQLELQGEETKALAAMGFLTVGRRFMNRQQDIIDDRIDVVTRGLLGMSVACARCHDHKYDPIPTADYYSLYGVFDSCIEPEELPLLGNPESSPLYEDFLQAKANEQRELDGWLEEQRVTIEDELRSRVADYFVYFARTLPEYKTGDIRMQGERGPLRRQAVARWQQVMAGQADSPHPVWSLLLELGKISKADFAKQAPALWQADIAQDRGAPGSKRLLSALGEHSPPDMIAATEIIGKELEAVYEQWNEARRADPTLERLPDEEDETLRQVLFASDAPTTLDTAQALDHLDQAVRNEYNRRLNRVNSVEVTHAGAPARGMVLLDKATPVEPVIFRRGQPSNRGDRVPRRFPQVLSHVDGGEPFRSGSGRLELARAIASPSNPLTARVIVNRVWQHQFGAGLVRTPSDFGTRGEPPTHPELLDYLAAEFMADGWSIKRLQRRIMLSSTWQQSSEFSERAQRTDPENRLLWHMPRRRMEFEPLRDRLLAAAGRLDSTLGGRSVMIHQDATRRALYAYMDREDVPGLLASFDVPSPDASQAKRAETTVPQQALYLMNAEFVIAQAKSLSQRTQSFGSSETPAARVQAMYRYALARDPEPSEMELALQYVESAAEGSLGAEPTPPLDPWTQLAQVLLLCNEFAFVD